MTYSDRCFRQAHKAPIKAIPSATCSADCCAVRIRCAKTGFESWCSSLVRSRQIKVLGLFRMPTSFGARQDQINRTTEQIDG